MGWIEASAQSDLNEFVSGSFGFGLQTSPFWAYGLHNVWIALGLFFCKSATWNLWTFFSFRDEISAPSGIDLELE
ncbi:hypothetical protein RhiirA5_434822 [Rhizophagus irregularis]|uniref:Uncharacterized protein n=1 Tax=Rhizophagus irregularis TaxID=588596 RepID=A0A2N0QZV5_9GLOM|nr:hypothetical protein RhiirA5_434822 [Rhizophagus irregularis]PKC56596.1 hypothetical protein RhiirA1_473769 [Rhizophagus irregularis]